MKTINFGAGPAKLPEEVMEKARDDFLDYKGTGISVIEMSHRSQEYGEINDQAQKDLRSILNIPLNYKILFMQGGGTGIFAAVAMNLIGRTGTADYIVTGSWSTKAAKEAKKYGNVNLVCPETKVHNEVPDQSVWKLDSNASYVYYCANETIHGLEFPFVPDVNVPIVADMSSNFLSRPIDVSKFGVIFAAAQKNIGPSGVTVVIVRDDLLNQALPTCPLILNFTVMANDNSLHNTPPTFCVYIMGLVFQWALKEGGISEIEAKAIEKSNLLYKAIDSSDGFYVNWVKPNFRSRMNVPFRIKNNDLEAKFLKEAKEKGMIQLKGHRLVGGIRASLYNAITLAETETLVSFMKEFREKHLV